MIACILMIILIAVIFIAISYNWEFVNKLLNINFHKNEIRLIALQVFLLLAFCSLAISSLKIFIKVENKNNKNQKNA